MGEYVDTGGYACSYAIAVNVTDHRSLDFSLYGEEFGCS